VRKHDVTMPLWYWQRGLERRLRAWGVDPE
jgi:hypothetical protein